MNIQKIRSMVLLISFLLLPVTLIYFSPVIILMGASEGVISGSALLFTAAFILSLFFGRIWCSWICPFGSLQDRVLEINDKRVINPWIERIRYGIFIIWIVLLLALFIRAGILLIDPFYATTHGLSVADYPSIITYTVVIVIITIITLILGRRGGCHLFCPISVLLSIGRKISNLTRLPALRLRAEKGLCNQCGRCTKTCIMSLDVRSMVSEEKMENPNCTLCGLCVDVCPKKVLSLSFSCPKKE